MGIEIAAIGASIWAGVSAAAAATASAATTVATGIGTAAGLGAGGALAGAAGSTGLATAGGFTILGGAALGATAMSTGMFGLDRPKGMPGFQMPGYSAPSYADASAKAKADDLMRRRKASDAGSTLLTGGSGLTETAPIGKKTLLGQ